MPNEDPASHGPLATASTLRRLGDTDAARKGREAPAEVRVQAPSGEGRGGAGPVGGARWAGRAVCAAAGAFKPGLSGSHGAFAAREPTRRDSSGLPLRPRLSPGHGAAIPGDAPLRVGFDSESHAAGK